jgi:hypothetical protein
VWSKPHSTCPTCRQPVSPSPGGYRVRWAIDVDANDPVDAARRARQVQLQPTSLATVFDVLRHDGTSDEGDWSLAETIDLTAHTRSDQQALDEIARVLRAPDWRGADDLSTSPSWSG